MHTHTALLLHIQITGTPSGAAGGGFSFSFAPPAAGKPLFPTPSAGAGTPQQKPLLVSIVCVCVYARAWMHVRACVRP